MASTLWGPNVVTAAAADNEGTLAWGAGGQSSAVAASTTVANTGAQSVRCTFNGAASGGLMVNNNTEIPAAASTSYVVVYAAYTTVSSVTLHTVLEFYTSGQAFISDNVSADVALTPNVWNPLPPQVVTTPATTAFIRLNPERASGMASGDFIYFDTFFVGRLLLGPAPTAVRQAPMRAAVW